MLNLFKSAIGGAGIAAMVATGSLAVPSANAEPGFYGAELIKVGGRGGKGGGKNWNRNNGGGHHHNYGHYNYGHYNYGWNNNWWIGPAIGLGTGILLGTALAQPRYYAGNRDAYCHSRYRSYNSYTRTYTGYDGRQHYC